MKEIEKIIDKLNNYDQKDIVKMMEKFTEEEKEKLAEQVENLDLDMVMNLYKNAKNIPAIDENKIEHISYTDLYALSEEKFKEYKEIGSKVIRDNKYAVVTMAGGQGTRLGYKGPKGTYELDFEQEHCRKSLFEIMCENIKNANNQYDITLPWYIMTSEDNDFATKEYFKSHNFFDYPKEKIKFFKQEKLPIINIDGKLILKETYLIKDGSNGNGNVFKAMKNNKIIDDLEKNNIKWVSFGGIDNILLKNIDPLFIGLTVDSGYQIASKSIFKQKPLDKVAVYCKKSGKPSILDYDDIDIKLSVSKSKDGMYQYREANILSHLMNLEAIKKVSTIHLPYHRAYKKNAFVNEEGMKQIPDKPNSFKFENFIFDSFAFFDDMLLLRVDENEEFAPIKDFTGIYNPDTAKEKYEKYWNKIKI